MTAATMPTLDKGRNWPGHDIHGPDTRERLYLAAGWETCYHRDGAAYHYNVKLDGAARWRGFSDAVAALEDGRPGFDRERFEELADGREESDRQAWWDDIRYQLAEVTGYRPADLRVWSCGRSGGYVNVPTIENDAAAMLTVAGYLEGERDYYNGRDAAAELVAQTLDDYDAETLAGLAAGVTCPTCATIIEGVPA